MTDKDREAAAGFSCMGLLVVLPATAVWAFVEHTAEEPVLRTSVLAGIGGACLLASLFVAWILCAVISTHGPRP